MTQTTAIPEDVDLAVESTTSYSNTATCSHCKKSFTATVDLLQPPRFQGAKCPHCKLFVRAELIPRPMTREERQRRG